MDIVEKQWKSIYFIGGVTATLCLCAIIADMIIGSITGADLTLLPKTAIDRFVQLNDKPLLGLYNMDLLNVITQILMIPTIFAIYAAHRNVDKANALLALILFVTGSILFVAGNTALTMFDLSRKYFEATTDAQRYLIESAGEAMLAKGAHGSLSVFIGFVLPTIANILMSVGMIKGRVFGSVTAYFGVIGNSFLLVYLVLVTFFPAIEKFALAIAMPGGLMVLGWMVLLTIKLFKLRISAN